MKCENEKAWPKILNKGVKHLFKEKQYCFLITCLATRSSYSQQRIPNAIFSLNKSYFSIFISAVRTWEYLGVKFFKCEGIALYFPKSGVKCVIKVKSGYMSIIFPIIFGTQKLRPLNIDFKVKGLFNKKNFKKKLKINFFIVWQNSWACLSCNFKKNCKESLLFFKNGIPKSYITKTNQHKLSYFSNFNNMFSKRVGVEIMENFEMRERIVAIS